MPTKTTTGTPFVIAAAAVAVALSMFVVAPLSAQTTEDASKMIELRLEGACDKDNSRLFVFNNHASRSVVVTLRWNLARAKRVASDQFVVTAGNSREIGCAAQAVVVSAVFME
jgi:hypothetical protein